MNYICVRRGNRRQGRSTFYWDTETKELREEGFSYGESWWSIRGKYEADQVIKLLGIKPTSKVYEKLTELIPA